MIIPQQVSIDEQGITIAYVEDVELDNAKAGGVIKAEQLSIPGDVCKTEVDDLIEAIRDLVDAALLKRRAPVDMFRDRDRSHE